MRSNRFSFFDFNSWCSARLKIVKKKKSYYERKGLHVLVKVLGFIHFINIHFSHANKPSIYNFVVRDGVIYLKTISHVDSELTRARVTVIACLTSANLFSLFKTHNAVSIYTLPDYVEFSV